MEYYILASGSAGNCCALVNEKKEILLIDCGISIVEIKNKLGIVRFLFLGYAITILIGSLLLSLSYASATGVRHSYIDCLFTATSATCVTGLVPFDTGLGWSLFGQIVILLLIQIGGLGFMTIICVLFVILKQRISLHNQNMVIAAEGGISR